MTNESPALISIVIPCFNEAEVFPFLRQALINLGKELLPRYRLEFIFIDDGSTDATWEQILKFSTEDKRVRGVSFSRNFGQQAAITCGYDLAEGDAVITLDADLQDPPDVILHLLNEWEKGVDIVYAVRTGREGEGKIKRWTASLFYRMISFLSENPAPSESGDFRLMSRRSILALRNLREQHRYIRGMVGWIGFRSSVVNYQRKPRAAGSTKYPLIKMTRLALDAIVSSSILPLRLTYLFAIAASLVFLGYLVYAVIRHLFYNAPLVPGWSSLILSVIVFGFLVLLCLGIMGEYLGRTYEQSKNRPLYLIKNSLLNEDRRV